MPGKRSVVRLLALLLSLFPAVQYGVGCVSVAAADTEADRHAVGAPAATAASPPGECCPHNDGDDCDGFSPPAQPVVDYECCVLAAEATVASATGSRPGAAYAASYTADDAGGAAENAGDITALIANGPAPPAARRSPGAAPPGPQAIARARVPLWLSTARLRL